MLIVFTFGRVRAFARLAAVLLDMIFTIHLNRQTDTNTRGIRGARGNSWNHFVQQKIKVKK